MDMGLLGWSLKILKVDSYIFYTIVQYFIQMGF